MKGEGAKKVGILKLWGYHSTVW